jgi:8-oxo-dGTP pyrophosphatase MutT (NUDIX family)
MHSDAMSGTASQRSGRFVRLSQLRKLRECEQVAAVCYRVRHGRVEFLLVQTRGSGRWTFPKGSTEPGLTHAQAAALEAFEEAGVHGRIEEAPFARYVRGPRGRANCGLKGSAEPVVVKAYLCEVIRLTDPKESNRNRTWFSREDARQNLKDGRSTVEGLGLARVLNQAVERILQSHEGAGAEEAQEDRYGKARIERFTNPRDPMQKVKFEFAEVYGRAGESQVLVPPRRSGAVRQSVLSAGVYDPPSLRGDILEFDVSRKKKMRALVTGGNHS